MTAGRPPPGAKLFVNGMKKASGYGYDRWDRAGRLLNVRLTLMRTGGMYSAKKGTWIPGTAMGAPRIYIGGTCGEVWSAVNVKARGWR